MTSKSQSKARVFKDRIHRFRARLRDSEATTAWFLVAYGSVLVFLGLSTLTVLVTGYGMYDVKDPVLGIGIRSVLGALGGTELVTGLACLFWPGYRFGLVLGGWLAVNLILYRGGLLAMGWKHPYQWVAPLSDRWGLPVPVADVSLCALWVMGFVGCVGLLLFGRTKTTPRGYVKIACPNCGGRIEFPVHAAGAEVPCPHCAKPIQLTLPQR